jgi:hypothetical protein
MENPTVSADKLPLTEKMVKSEHLPLIDLDVRSGNLPNLTFLLLQQRTFRFRIAVRTSSAI